MRFKEIIKKIHLILGLTTGMVVLIVAITGCCWVFKEEITELFEKDHQIKAGDKTMISPTRAKSEAKKIFPDKHVHGSLFGDLDDPVEVIFYEPKPEFYQSVFLHPATGEVLDIQNHLAGFFHFVLDGHMYLWLPEPIGTEIVRFSILIFVISLVTGIILWWPKNKNKSQRYLFKWKPATRWRRKNFDLHSILGFYASVFALIIAFTGLIMAFDWVKQATYTTLGGKKDIHFQIPYTHSNENEGTQNSIPPIDRLLPKLQQNYPDAPRLEIHYPNTDSSSIYVEVFNDETLYYNSSYLYFDQNTLKPVEAPSLYGPYEKASMAGKFIRMNYDIHIGAILGLPGKILAFLVSLIVASLPVTGFLFWWGRKRKSIPKNYKPVEKAYTNNKVSKVFSD